MFLAKPENNEKYISGEELAKKQSEISISEFFEKNKHLLGFDNPTKALLIIVKEAVDNSIDACEETGILPDIRVIMKEIKEDTYKIIVEDNGPGLPKENLAKTFGKFLYGSKFHHLLQKRGQQGIGITGSIMYAQLTTGKPALIWSKTEKSRTYFVKMLLNVTKNEAEVLEEKYIESRDEIKEHGIRIELEVSGKYRKTQSVDDYLMQTAISNPFVKIKYTAPDGETITFGRAVDKLPKSPKEIKPHPYGVELGIMLRMLKTTSSRSILGFLTNEFSSLGAVTATKACQNIKLDTKTPPDKIERETAEKLLKTLQGMEIQRPPTDCLSPIGNEEFKNGLKKQFPTAEMIITESRPPDVYRGYPFQIETALVYDPATLKNDSAKLLRFANKAPLLYQQSSCAITKAVVNVDWKRYGLDQNKNSIPNGPCIIIVHMCSVWVPFVSEGKEAIAPYPTIMKEMKLALQQCARKLSIYLSGKRRETQNQRRLEIFQRYAPEIQEAVAQLIEKPEKEVKPYFDKMLSERTKKKHFEDEELGENSEAIEEKKPVSKDAKKPASKQKPLKDEEENGE
jgi:DNA topoisomerase-6 subunit B